MRATGAAELESRMNQDESDTTNPEQEVPEKGTGHSQLLLLAPRDPPLVLHCSTAKCYRAHTYHCLIFGGLLLSVKIESHTRGKRVGNEGTTLWSHGLMATQYPWMTVLNKHSRTTVSSTYI